MSQKFLIVGLGNPGPEYADTRHNAGFWFVNQLAARHGQGFRLRGKLHGEECRVVIAGLTCALLKPNTFVNRSGQAVRAFLDWYNQPPGQLLVVHDELDLPAGIVRLKQGGGHGGHNGLRDIHSHLGTPDYLRLRLGVGHPGNKSRVVGYVLGRTPGADRAAIDRAIDRAVDVLPDILQGRLAVAMNHLHRSDPPDGD